MLNLTTITNWDRVANRLLAGAEALPVANAHFSCHVQKLKKVNFCVASDGATVDPAEVSNKLSIFHHHLDLWVVVGSHSITWFVSCSNPGHRLRGLYESSELHTLGDLPGKMVRTRDEVLSLRQCNTIGPQFTASLFLSLRQCNRENALVLDQHSAPLLHTDNQWTNLRAIEGKGWDTWRSNRREKS